MKKLSLTYLLILVFFSVRSQTIAEGISMLQYRRYPSAIKIFVSILNNHRSDSVALYWLGETYLRNKETAKAIATFKRMANISHSPLLSAGLAEAYHATGQFRQVSYLLNRLPKEPAYMSNADLSVAISRIHTIRKEHLIAGAFLERAEQLRPCDAAILVALSKNQQIQGNISAAAQYLTQAIYADSDNASPFYQMARLKSMNGHAKKYLFYLHEAIEKDSLFAPAWEELYRFSFYFDKDKKLPNYRQFLAHCDPTFNQRCQLIALDFLEMKYDQVTVVTSHQ